MSTFTLGVLRGAVCFGCVGGYGGVSEWQRACPRRGGFSVVSMLHWGYFGQGRRSLFLERVGGLEEVYERVYAVFGAENV